MPGPRAPPGNNRPSLKMTALSYSWTIWKYSMEMKYLKHPRHSRHSRHSSTQDIQALETFKSYKMTFSWERYEVANIIERPAYLGQGILLSLWQTPSTLHINYLNAEKCRKGECKENKNVAEERDDQATNPQISYKFKWSYIIRCLKQTANRLVSKESRVNCLPTRRLSSPSRRILLNTL